MSNQAQGATAPTIFQSESTQLRVVTIDGEPWFIAADVCAALELGNNRQATVRLDDDERGVILTDTPSGQQQMTIINESGLYSLILGSRKPEARKFKKWVTSEVLPAIRKTGRYQIDKATLATTADRKPLVKAVRNLVKVAESKGRSLSYSDAHSIINLKMGVIDVEHLSVDQIPQAMVLVGELLERIVLEGDYLPRNTAATSPALPAGPELLTQNDMSNLQSVIWKITQTLPLRDRFIQTIWCSLRLATNNPSPAPFTVDHLPVIVDDLRRVSRMIHLFSNQVSNAQCDLLQSILAASPEQSNDAAIGDIRALLHKLDIMEADRMSHRISQYCERSIAALGERRQARAIPARAAENAALQFSI
jgi:prophage antirepressor-like protein